MLDLNVTVLSAVVDQALADAADHPRWIAAITKATVEILSNPLIARQDGHLLVASKSTAAIHSANGTCTCEAFKFGQPCWHRAAARLVRRHDERQAAAAETAERVIATVAQITPAERWAQAKREIDACFGIGAD